jgi:hypothetical protein
MTYRLIGLWWGDHAREWPAVEAFIAPNSDEARREKVAARLDQGDRTDRAYMGYSQCRLCGCRNGSGERTDGVFVWPEGLAHYVREHRVRLPEVIESQLLAQARPDPAVAAGAVRASNDERDANWWKELTGVGRTESEGA